MYLIDEYLKTGGPPNDGDKILIGLVLSSGGFSGAGRGLSERGLLSRYKKARKELIHVVEIVDFLVRCAVHPIDGGRCNLKVAQKFVEKMQQREKKFEFRTINRDWENFAIAAPYIYAIYSERTFDRPKNRYAETYISMDIVVRSLSEASRSIFGPGGICDGGDFAFQPSTADKGSQGIAQVIPRVRPFDDRERSFILNIDSNAAIDAPSYRPKVKPFKRPPTGHV
jgi:hypothetical protein